MACFHGTLEISSRPCRPVSTRIDLADDSIGTLGDQLNRSYMNVVRASNRIKYDTDRSICQVAALIDVGPPITCGRTKVSRATAGKIRPRSGTRQVNVACSQPQCYRCECICSCDGARKVCRQIEKGKFAIPMCILKNNCKFVDDRAHIAPVPAVCPRSLGGRIHAAPASLRERPLASTPKPRPLASASTPRLRSLEVCIYAAFACMIVSCICARSRPRLHYTRIYRKLVADFCRHRRRLVFPSVHVHTDPYLLEFGPILFADRDAGHSSPRQQWQHNAHVFRKPGVGFC